MSARAIPEADLPSERSPVTPFEMPLAITETDIDELGHVNNVVYLAWVQQVAIAHWNFLTTAAQRDRVVWVALRHEIDYLAEAVPGDRLLARTWTGVARGLRYPRHTEIIRIDGSKVLARAVTAWCPLDATSARPTRLPPDMAAWFGKPDVPA